MLRPRSASSAIGLTRTADLLTAVICKPYAGELPARLRRKEVAIGCANMRAGRHAGAATQHHLSAHEFAVVFAERASGGLVPGIRQIGAGCPLPDIAKDLLG